MWNYIIKEIEKATEKEFSTMIVGPIGGGSINQAYLLSNNEGCFFVKLNSAQLGDMFQAEMRGLTQIAQTHTIRVPNPICTGTINNQSYLVLEWLSLSNNSNWEAMGQALAKLHQFQPPHPRYGWDINNTIGSTPQINTWSDNWIEFWQNHRIGFQLQLAKRRGGVFPQAQKLLDMIPELLANHHPQPSLVHGDLWGGNAGFTMSGEPVIYDPATYWGDREVDLAMTELFGGFGASFYRGYNQTWEIPVGYEQRKILYNLYHILNHYNLFGGSYLNQANRMIERLLSN